MEPRVAGIVVLIEGVVFARSADGRQRQLRHGDSVFEGEVISALADGQVELAFTHGGRFLLRSGESVTLGTWLFDNVFGQAEHDGRSAVLGGVAENRDAAEAEAAGLDQAAEPDEESQGSAGLNDRIGLDVMHGFVRLDRIGEPLTNAGYRFSGDTPLIGVEYEGATVAAHAAPTALPPAGPADPQPPRQLTPGPQVMAEDGALVFSAANGNGITVSDADSGTLVTTLQVSSGTLLIAQQAALTVTGNGTGTVTLEGSPAAINRALDGLVFRPLPDDTSTATLTAITSDGERSVGASVQVQVTPQPDAPIGRADTATTPEDTQLRISVTALLANDRDPDGDLLSITGVGGAVGGTVALAGGNVVFTPSAGFSGAGSFRYMLSDGKGGTDTAAVSVTVVAGSDPPGPTSFGGARSGSGAEDAGAISGTLRASDPDGMSAPAFTIVGAPVRGTATIDPVVGAWRYTPAADANGADSFTVRVTDNDGNTSVQVIGLTVAAVADILANAATVAEDGSVGTNLLANDSFEGVPTIVAVTDGANGTVTIIDADAGTVRYTPNANFHGTDSYSYTVRSGDVIETATVTVTVTAVDDATAFGGGIGGAGTEDAAAITGTLWAVDADGMAAPAFTVSGSPLHGTATIDAATGAWSYIAAADYHGADSFTVTATDDDGTTARRVINLSVTPAVDIVGDRATTAEDTAITRDVLANDSFEAIDRSITAVTDGAHGTVAIIDPALGLVRYTPDANYHGSDAYSYTVSSGGVSETVTVDVTITPVDDATTFAGAASGAGAEDGGAITGTLAAADAADGMAAPAFTVAGIPAHGSATIDADTGAWSYTPAADYNGPDSFTVAVTDDAGNTATRVISLNVTSVADIVGDTASAAEDGSVTTGVLGNDGFKGTPVITAAINGANGSVTIVDAGTVLYTPNANFHGSDSYTYTVSSGGVTETATVTVTVSPVNDAALFGGATAASGAEDVAAITGTLTATDADGMTAPAFAVVGNPSNGTATIDAGGGWTYVPDADYNGPDSFTVRVTDDAGNTSTQVISLTVAAVADILGNAVTMAEDGSVTTNVRADDSFEGLTPTITAVTHGANGTVTVVDAAAGTVRYTPNANWHGIDSYTYTVTSGGVTETATVVVTVDPLDDPTSFTGATAGSDVEDAPAITGTLGATDADALAAAPFSVTGNPAHGAASIDAVTGAWTYTPVADYNGPDSFTVRVTDNDGNTSSRVISLTVTAAADIAGDTATVNEDGSVTTSVLANDGFEGTPTITAVTSGANGTVTIVDPVAGTVAYTPNANFNGTDSYTYSVASGGVTETATVTVTVAPVDDGTVFGGGIGGSGTEDGAAITGTLTVGDADGITAPAFTVSANGVHGVAGINAGGSWSYVPHPDSNGPDSFTVSVTDDAGNVSTRVINLAVADVADALGDTATLAEDASVTTAVLLNDGFAGTPTITSVTQGANGAVTILDPVAGTVVYTPSANFHGTDSYTYTVTSGGVTETAMVNVTVDPVDDAPSFGGATSGSGAEDVAAITGTLTVADADGITAPAFAVTGDPAHGTASIDPVTGAWTYIPARDSNGADSFTVTVTDNLGNTASRVISLALSAVADVLNDTEAVNEDGSVISAVRGNDSFEGLAPTVTSVTGGANGTVTIIDAAAGTVQYTPNANWHGTDTYTYTVTSGGVTETATVTVIVNPVDDPATFGGNSAGTANEDAGAITGKLTVADAADGMAAPVFTVGGTPAHGLASINAVTGAWSYTPTADYNGADSFTISVTDGSGNTATQVIALTVVAVMDIAPNAAGVNEDGSVSTDVLANDSFENAGAAITAVTQGANGSVAIVGGALGTVLYTPNANWHGTDTYTYTVTAGGVTETATVTVSVGQLDDPAAFSGGTSGAGNEDAGTIIGTLTVADAADGLAASAFAVIGNPAHGTATINAATGAWSYTPAADYNGADSFTVRVTDGDGNTATQVIGLAVAAVVDIAPNAVVATEDGSVTAHLRANDSFEGPAAAITAVSNGAHGTVTIIDAALGTVRYTADPDWHGTDSYTYTVTSGGVTETATVSVTVTPVDDPGTFGGATSGSGSEDGGPITGTLQVADGGDGIATPAFTVTANGAHGTATIDLVTGQWSYLPVADYNGPDSFTVMVTDDDGNTSTQVITLGVSAVVDITGNTATVAEDGSVTSDVLTDDSFEGAGRAITALTQGAHGTVAIVDAALGTVLYTPAPNYHGLDSYTYTVTSGGVTETATANVTVSPVNDAPVFGGATTGLGAEDAGVIGGVLGVTDADGITNPGFSVTTAAGHGVATIDPGTGAWSYTPVPDYNGADSFTVTVTDNGGNTAARVINLSVTPVVDIAGDAASTVEDVAVITNVLANDSFEHAGRLLTGVTDGSNGTVTIINAAAGLVRYTPDPDFWGSDSYTYTVTAGGVSETVAVSVKVTQGSNPTTFSGATSGTGTEDGAAITGTLSASDPDGINAPNFAVTANGTHGVASINATTGAWIYTPLADYNGNDSFTVTVMDDAGNSATQVITLAVAPAVDIANDGASVAEDGSVATNVRTNDSFAVTATITSVTQGANGTVTIIDALAGTIRYTPDPDYNGPDSYTYTVTSGGVTETATVNVAVTQVDDPATLSGATSGTGDEDGLAITGGLNAADAADGIGAPNFAVTANGTHGVAGIDATTGAWSYTPNPDYNGADSFTVTVTDGDGNTATQVISLTVAPVVDITNDGDTVLEDSSVVTDVRANDSFAATATIISATQGAHGTVAIIDPAAGTIRYTPDPDYNGPDSYTYTVTSGGVTETATVNVAVTQVDDPSTFGGATSGSGSEDAIAITGTLTASDTADGLAPAFTVVGNGANGVATIDAGSGAWSYVPFPDYNGADSFTVRVTDGDGNTATQVISLTVAAAPDIVSDTARVSEDGSVTTGVLANEIFEGTPTVTAVTNGAHGTVTIIDPVLGTVQYTPAANWYGSDSYTYTVASGGVTEAATVNVTVTPVNDAPTFGGATSGGGDEDATITGTLVATDTADGMPAPNFSVSTGALNGSASINATTGLWTYVPFADSSGADSFTVTVTDALGNTATRVIGLSVAAVADIVGDSGATDEDTAVVTDVLFNDSFESSGRTIVAVTQGAHGTVAIVNAALGTVQYTPHAGYHGVDSYTYTVSSGGRTETATVLVGVGAVDSPAAFGGATSGSGNEDAGLITGTLTATDADGLATAAFTVTASAAHGVASIDPVTGAWSYTPHPDYNGPDSFTVSVTDDDDNVATQVISLTVAAVVDIQDDIGTVAEDGSLTTGVLANEVFEGTPTVTAVSQGAHGTVTILDPVLGTVQYTPDADYNGTDSYTYTVTSGGVAETATVNVVVTQVDDPTSFSGATSGSGTEDAAITGTLTAVDAADGMGTPNFAVSADPAHGTAGIDPQTGVWTYTPNPDYNGPDAFTVTVTDGDSNTATQVITLGVAAAPDILFDLVTVAEDGTVTTDLLDNDGFEGTPLVTAVTQGAHGTVTIVDAAAGTVSYTPGANYNGPDSYSYTVTSGGVTETVTVNVATTQVDDPTAFSGATGSGNEDGGAITGTLNVADAADGIAAPNFAVTANGAHGVAGINATSGAWSYTPNADYNGPDSFTVSVTDDDGNTATQVISLTLAPVVDIANDAATVLEDGSVTTNVRANDSFAATATVTAVTQGANGTVAVLDAAAGTISYTPSANFHGTDSYTYTVTSGGVTEAATVNVTVTPVNDAPTFGGATSGSGNEDRSIVGTLTATDTADGMTNAAFTVTANAAHGTATINAGTGAWSYTPNPDYNGTDSFTVRVTDNLGNIAARVISLTVNALADIVADAVTLAEDGAVVTDLVDNDSFEGAPLLTAVTQGAHGSVTIVNAAAGTVEYAPDANWHGTDSYTYTVSSGGVTETATVTVTVGQVDDPATFGGATSGSGNEDAGIVGTLTATDAIDGMTTPAFTVVGNAVHGTAAINAATGAWNYVATADYHGTDSFTVRVTDNNGNSATQVITLNVAAVADAVNDASTVAEDGSVTTAVRGNDSFEGAAPTVTAVSNGTNGTVTIVNAATGTVRYAPNANWYGTDSYTYTVTSGGVTETATVTVTVGQADDPTTFGGATSGAGNEDAAITATLAATDAADGMATPNFTVIGNAANGTATIDPTTGAWTYTPAADYNGADSFTVRVTDGSGNTSTQVISLAVAAVADIVADTAITGQGVAVIIDVLGNETFEGTPQIVAVDGNAITDGGAGVNVAGGSVALVGGELVFSPATGFSGSPTFSYTVRSGGVTETAAVGVTVVATPGIAGVSSPSETEGTALVYGVTLSHGSPVATSHVYVIGGGTAAGADYGAVTFTNGVTLSGGVLTVPADITSFDIVVAGAQDLLDEAAETLLVSVGGITGAGTIGDDDATPSLSIDDVVVNEAAGTATFTVTLSAASGQTVTVGYGTADGSAVAAADYTGAGGTLTFAPGVLTQTVVVSITSDGVFEAGEGFTVGLSGASNASIADGSGAGSIIDNDAAPVVTTISSPMVTEGAGLVYTITLSNASSSSTSIGLTVTGSASAVLDYGITPVFSDGVTIAGGNLVVPAGVTSFTATIPTLDDALDEAAETLVVAGDSGVVGTGTILDDDATPTLTINHRSVNEAAASVTFTVALSAPSGQTVTVDYATGNGTGAAPGDYTGASGTLTFAPGAVTQTVTIAIVDDTAAEASETFNVLLSAPVNATIAAGAGVATIVDNDQPPVIDLDASAGGSGYASTFTENGAAVAVADSDIAITDVDSANLAGATIALTDGQDGDALAAGAMPAGITASVVGNVVTLTGVASRADYQAAIRAVTFSNGSENPVGGARSIEVVVNDGNASSVTAVATITVLPINDAPVNAVPGAHGTSEDATRVFSTGNGNAITVGDIDSTNLSTVVSVTNGTLTAVSGGGATITGNGTASVTITGTPAQIGAALDGMGFAPSANYNGGALLTATTSDGALSDVDTVAITVAAVNDAPVLANTVLTLAAINEDAAAPAGAVGTLVSTLLGGSTDVDAGAAKGIAITAADSANGTWYYSTDAGTTWTAVGPVANSGALLLSSDASTRLYFQPNADYDGTVGTGLTVRAWDTTSGAAGAKVDASSNGGTTAFSSATDTVAIVVNPVNDAPMLAGTVLALVAVNEDAAVPAGAVGSLVATLVGGSSDVDAGAVKGIAITAADATNGTWYYSTSAGTTWTALGAVANNSALLLASDASTRVYFQPNANYNGTVGVGLTMRGWDTTTGTAGAKVDTSTNGATTAFSTATDTVSVVVNPVNDAPVLADTVLTLTAVNEDAVAPSGAVGSLVSTLVGGSTDVDAGAVKGIAITAADAANGAWYYSTDGGTSWAAVGAVADSSALLLASDANTRVYFQPNADDNGTVATGLTVRAWDTSSGTAGSKVDASSNGGTSGFSLATDAVSIIVNPLNDAPVLADTVLALAAVNEDAVAPAGAVGTLVSTLVGGSSDVDAGALKGVAITAADAGNGTWYYSTNAGTTWTAVGAVADNSALLLASDANTRVYFQPNADYNATVATGLTVRAWDTTSGSAGDKVDASTNGGKTAFSSAADTVSVVVNPVNDAPILADTVLALAAVNEDAAVPSGAVGTLVSTLVGGSSDVDAGAAKGIAITAADAGNGTWYYSINAGTTWTAVGAVANNSALLLASDASTRVYFQPNANDNGTVPTALTVRAWDTTTGSAGSKVDSATNGGTTAFSTATDTVSIAVNPVNDAPVLADTVLTLVAVNEDVGAPSDAVGTLVSTLVGGSGDVDAAAVKGLAITAADTANGSWYYSVDGGTNWLAVGAVANNSALLLASDASTRLYFQPNANYNGTVAAGLTVRAWDATTGAAGSKVDASTNGGSTAFSAATDTVSITINPVNDAPVLADTALALAAVAEDAAAPAGAVGTLVAGLVGGSVDVDAGAVKGIAITASDSANGTWYYSTNAGGAWTAVGAVANDSALLLASDAKTRVYFRPNADSNGTLASGLTVRAWDLTSGAAGAKVDTGTNGDATAFSWATDQVAITVTAVNDAPVLADTVLGLPAINEDAPAPVGAVGTLVSTLVGGSGDIDAAAVKGLAITAADAANGSWYYSVDGGTNWLAVGAVANNSALLLASDASTRLYFQPNANYNGTVAAGLTVRAWDTTTGAAGSKVDASTNGASTAFSTSTDTVSLAVDPVNDAPVGVADSYSAAEGSTATRSSVLANDTDVDGPATTAWQVASTAAGTIIPVNGTNAVTTALGGTVVMNADGTFTYTAPARNHADATADVDSFVYRASDGSANSAWVTVSLPITDTGPVATADTDTVSLGSSTSGNVIAGTGGPAADIIGADTAQISAITYNAVAVTPGGGVWTVNTGTGTLTISASGAYTYTSTAPGNLAVGAPANLAAWTGAISSYGFDGAEPYNTGTTVTSGLNLSTLVAARTSEVRYRGNGGSDDDGIGVENTSGTNTTDAIQNGEDLVLDLGRLSQSTTVNLTALAGGETAQWHAYGGDGAWIASGTIAGDADSQVTGTIADATPFQYLVFTSTGSAYRVNGINVTAYAPAVAIDYTLADADGSTSTATLTVNMTTSVTLQGDTATLSESRLSAGTAPRPGGAVTSGNLLDNDFGLSAGAVINRVTAGTTDFTADGNGVIAANDGYGTLVVYTTAFAGHLAGDYTYTLTAPTAQPGTDMRTFSYGVLDGATNYSANLAIAVVDDAPSATSAVAQVAEMPAASYNLVLMLDISASMYANNAGGEVRSVDANGNAIETTRLAMAKTGLIALVEEYFSQAAGVAVKLGLFASGATMLNGGATYTSKAALIAAISGISGTELTSSTDYDAGIDAMRTAFGTPSSSVVNVSYFLSDGAPTNAANAKAAIATYQAFASANNIRSYAVGIGTGIADVSYLNNLHTVDGDASGASDAAVIVPDLNKLDETLISTVPSAYTGSVGGTGGASNVTFGADGGYIRYIEVMLDSNADTVPDQMVRFTYDPGTGQVTQNSSFLTGFPMTATAVNLGSASGFVYGSLVLDFLAGEYTYYTATSVVEGDEFVIGFQVMDGDGDTAIAVQTIRVVDGKPVARDDADTLMPGQTMFEANVVNGAGTDGGTTDMITDFMSSSVSKDTILDGAVITSVSFKGTSFDLTSNASGAVAGGDWTITGGRLTWTSSTEPANVLVFDQGGYYRYTPPADQTLAPTAAPTVTTLFNSSANADDNGITLSGFSRLANLTGTPTYAHAALSYADLTGTADDGVGVPAGEAAGTVDDLETLVITFNAADHAYGVQDVTLTINTNNSNLSSAINVTRAADGTAYGNVVTTVTYTVYDVSGNLLGQFSSFAEGAIAIPAGYSNIGRIELQANSAAQARVQNISFRHITGGGTAAPVAPETIGYTLTDSDGDTSSAELMLGVITNHMAGTAAGDTRTGTGANDYISGQGGNDTLTGAAGYDLIRGDAGSDSIDGGADADRLFGGAGDDTVAGGTGADDIKGDAGDDVLTGNDGNDIVRGGAGSDVINGGLGADTLLGGAGNDTIDSGNDLVSDVFKWELADTGAKGAPAVDTVTNFSAVAAGSGGDVLDLRDLLVGENQLSTNLDDYLHFEKSGANTIIHVSASGEFASGYSPTREVQTIVLQGVDLVGTMNTDQQIIQDLLTKGKLLTD